MIYDADALRGHIQERLKKTGKTQKSVLQAVGASENLLNQMTDKKGISSFVLARIADELDCSVDFLLGRENKKSAPDQTVRSAVYEKISQLSDPQLDRLLGYLEGLLSE